MNCRSYMINELAYASHYDAPGRTLRAKKANAGCANVLRSILWFVPIINMIFGIVILSIYECKPRFSKLNDPHRIPRIIAYSLCIASLGILLLPLVIMGTIAKIDQDRGNRAPSLTLKKIKEVPPDYLL